jgi:hypothetical protein
MLNYVQEKAVVACIKTPTSLHYGMYEDNKRNPHSE